MILLIYLMVLTQFLIFKINNSHSLTMMSTVNTEFSFVQVWFIDQISKAPEIEDNVNVTLIIG